MLVVLRIVVGLLGDSPRFRCVRSSTWPPYGHLLLDLVGIATIVAKLVTVFGMFKTGKTRNYETINGIS